MTTLFFVFYSVFTGTGMNLGSHGAPFV